MIKTLLRNKNKGIGKAIAKGLSRFVFSAVRVQQFLVNIVKIVLKRVVKASISPLKL